MSNILEIKNLNYKYDKTTIFKNFNLTVKENSYIGIVGNNTSGKTTLTKLIAGILPSKDSIIIGYSYVNDKRFQDHSKELASLFDISKLLDKKTSDLTNSEKQELLLVISLLHEPKILVIDNAFSMMNKKTKEKMKKALTDYKSKYNLTIILMSTNLEDALDTDYLYILNKGNIVVEGLPNVVVKEDTLLNRLGISLPFMVDLSLKLEFYELIDHVEMDINRLVNDLWK